MHLEKQDSAPEAATAPWWHQLDSGALNERPDVPEQKQKANHFTPQHVIAGQKMQYRETTAH